MDIQIDGRKGKRVIIASTAGSGVLVSTIAAAALHHPSPFVYGGLATLSALVAFGRSPNEMYEKIDVFLSDRSQGLQPLPGDRVWGKIGNAMMGVRPVVVDDDSHQPVPPVEPPSLPKNEPEAETQETQNMEEFDPFLGSDIDRRILISPEFQPDGNTMVSTGAIAFGCQGSGKTTVLARIFEQYIAKFEIPCLIFCSQGDFLSIVRDGMCPRGMIATPDAIPTAKDIIANRLQVVVDLNAWHKPGHIGVSPDLAVPMMTELIHGLIVEQSVIDPELRVPVLVGLDEVHLWVPQGQTRRMTPENTVRMYDAAVELTTTGRKYGVVPFFATQRIALVDKDVIGSFETRFFGKVDQDVDVKRYWEHLPKAVFTEAMIRSLQKGRMIVTLAGQSVLTQTYNRQTTHLSHTPRVSRSLVGQKSRMSAEQITQILSVTPTDEVEDEEEAVEERHYRHGVRHIQSAQVRKEQRLAGLRKAPVTGVVVKPAEGGPVPSIEEVETAFPEGIPSKRAIMAHFGIKDNQAWKIYIVLKKKRGYA